MKELSDECTYFLLAIIVENEMEPKETQSVENFVASMNSFIKSEALL